MNNFFIHNFLSLILIMASLYGQAQNKAIMGRVIDKQTREVIPFAHILIEGTPIGTISDLNGNFEFEYPVEHRLAALQVSCLGYKPFRLMLKAMDGPTLEIILEQDVVQLEEVVVMPEDPLELFKEAFRRIPENYDTTSTLLSGYYKVSSRMGDSNVKYTEAFIDIFKPPYTGPGDGNSFRADSIHLREIRTKRSEIDDWKLANMLPWEKNIQLLETRDVVKEFLFEKNAFKKFLSRYRFEIENMVWIEGRRNYKIRVKPKGNKKDAYWNGHIFLDEETKAFVKIDFASTEKLFQQMKRDISFILASKLYNVNYDHGEWKETIHFQRFGDKWHFKEVNSSKYFVLSSKKRGLEKSPVTVNLHYTTDSVKSRVVYHETMDFLNPKEPWYVTAEYVAGKYNASFWEAFDRQRGVVQGDFFVDGDDTFTPTEGYQFTRLDTLQGMLTPLRTSFDVGFYHLDVEVLPQEEMIRGSSLIRFKVIDPTSRIQIDLYSAMSIDSIVHQGKLLNYEREYNAVYLDFARVLLKDSVEEILFFFSGRPLEVRMDIPMYASFLWMTDENENPWLQAICQGYGASGWWPNKDHLSDEPDSAAISVTVPSDLDVVANGRLRHKTTLENSKTRYDWFVSYPINNYNLTLNVGKYAHFSDQYVSGSDTLDLDYHVLGYNLENARKKVEMVKPMLKTYEKYFGKYPFPRDGFKLVETPHAMEHQSCVSLGYEYFSKPYESNTGMLERNLQNGYIEEQIVLHETAHEWWGNSMSCTDNAELWIHEAFATYAEALYIEDHYGYASSQLYLNAMKDGVRNVDPIIGKFNVNHIHYDINDMYLKGALMLNTLRHVINNDSLWFSIIKGIPTTFKYQSVTTGDIVSYITQATGVDYRWFFDQYLRTRQVPKLELNFERRDGREYVKYRWNTETPDFKMPVKYSLGNGDPLFLLPTSAWQKLKLPSHADRGDFEVNVEQFYIEVEVENLK